MCSGALPLHFTDGETEVQRGLWPAQDSTRPRLADWGDPVRSEGSTPQLRAVSAHLQCQGVGSGEKGLLAQQLNCLLPQTSRLGLQRKSGTRPPRGAEGKHTRFTRAPEK